MNRPPPSLGKRRGRVSLCSETADLRDTAIGHGEIDVSETALEACAGAADTRTGISRDIGVREADSRATWNEHGAREAICAHVLCGRAEFPELTVAAHAEFVSKFHTRPRRWAVVIGHAEARQTDPLFVLDEAVVADGTAQTDWARAIFWARGKRHTSHFVITSLETEAIGVTPIVFDGIRAAFPDDRIRRAEAIDAGLVGFARRAGATPNFTVDAQTRRGRVAILIGCTISIAVAADRTDAVEAELPRGTGVLRRTKMR